MPSCLAVSVWTLALYHRGAYCQWQSWVAAALDTSNDNFNEVSSKGTPPNFDDLQTPVSCSFCESGISFKWIPHFNQFRNTVHRGFSPEHSGPNDSTVKWSCFRRGKPMILRMTYFILSATPISPRFIFGRTISTSNHTTGNHVCKQRIQSPKTNIPFSH